MTLGYIILYVKDAIAAMQFYERAFGLTTRFIHDSEQYIEMETGGTALAFVAEAAARDHVGDFEPQRPGNRPSAFEVTFVTEDVEGAYQTALRAGATSFLAPTRKPWGQSVAYVRDLNGVLVELCTPMGA